MASTLVIFLSTCYLFLSVHGQRNCVRGSFKDKDGKCKLCPSGTFQQKKNECTPCPAGTYGLAPGRATIGICLSCPPGTFNPTQGAASIKECKPCPPGTDSGPKYSRCIACGKGKSVAKFGDPRERCVNCEKNTFSDQSSNRECKQCPPGTFASPGSDKCENCPKGTFRNTSGDCMKCSMGTFTDEEGSRFCKICPPGTFSKKGAKKCTSCPAGEFSSRIPSMKCTSCPSGTNSLGIKPAGCKDPTRGCPIDTFESSDGECEACLPGQKLDASAKQCVPCADDEVSGGGATTQCTKCPAGREPVKGYSLADGFECSCIIGTAASVFSSGDGSCKPCPTRQIDGPPGDDNLTGADGFFRFDRECRDCPSGNRASCFTCPAGTIVTNSGRGGRGFLILGSTSESSCTKCPDRTIVKGSSCISVETGCGIGEVLRNGNCIRGGCPPRFFYQKKGPCISCPEGMFRSRKSFCFSCHGRRRSAGGDVDKCTRCPKGETGFRNECVCTSDTERSAGKCVQCPPGTRSQPDSKCVPCPPGEILGTSKGKRSCRLCDDPTNFIVKGTGAARHCVKCPRGSRNGENVRGRRMNRCVPIDPYEDDEALLGRIKKVND